MEGVKFGSFCSLLNFSPAFFGALFSLVDVLFLQKPLALEMDDWETMLL